MGVEEILKDMESRWNAPKSATHGGTPTFFKLRCVVKWLPQPSPDHPPGLPSDVADLWRLMSQARLFEDEEYGQWGLVLEGPECAKNLTEEYRVRRSDDARPGDLVIGTFLGDSDLLVVRCASEARDFGQVVVATPLEHRQDWGVVSSSLAEFLASFGEAEGEKFWE